jgi:glycerol-3-phosphate O-acyltransferase
VKEGVATPYSFGHIHYAEHYPIDFYEFAREFVRPLIDMSKSCVLGKENVETITQTLEKRENVILLANHQTEIDSQVISLLLDPINEHLASSMFFLAGHRVTSDPIAIPFSRGTNILSIYSKKYVDSPPELRAEKLQHNARTLSGFSDLLNEGGVCVYVAASNGRDRLDESGKASVAPFDPQSVEMIHLLGKNAAQPTHFHLLALSTIDLLPPPPTINLELGEERPLSFGPARLYFGPCLELEKIGTAEDKKMRRIERSQELTREVTRMHDQLLNYRSS